MPLDITAELGRFDEAIAELRRRIILTPGEVERISLAARRKAFWMAGVAQLSVVQQVLDSLTSAVAHGVGIEQWRKGLGEGVRTAWGAKSSTRLTIIWRNATQRAYTSGRWEQMRQPVVAKHRPFWMYDAVLDSRTTDICRDRDGTILPADHEWWDTNYPPLHHQCRSAVRSLRARDAERRGITTSLGALPDVQAGFGHAPSPGDVLIDRTIPRGADPELAARFAAKLQASSGAQKVSG